MLKRTISYSVLLAAMLTTLFMVGCPASTVNVPNVIGLVLQSGEEAITDVNLVVGTVTYAFSDTVDPYVILQQDPMAGTNVVQGTAVNLVVSKGTAPLPGEWPGLENAYSWDGSWVPAEDALPPSGLFDDVYFDAHDVNGQPSPILPPGNWNRPGVLLGNWTAFKSQIGNFELLKDAALKAYGWRLLSNTPGATLINYHVDNFEGSSGTDIFDLGPEGRITQTATLALGDGPDMVRFRYASAADWRTGSDVSGGVHDNDLVVAGSMPALAAGKFDITTSTIHTGPGRDLIMISNIGRAAVDAGNGANGRTDTLDPLDGDDLIIVHGNAYDFRLYGGGGKDTFIWYVDEGIQTTPWLGASFFGAGGWGDAVWDNEPDRLVLVVPVETTVVNSLAATDPGSISIGLLNDYPPLPVSDNPTSEDYYTRYCETAGIGPTGQKTIIMRYVNTSQTIKTGYCYLTSVEEIQVGVGPTAKVYQIDQITGTPTEDAAATPVNTIPDRDILISQIETFAR